MGLMGANKMIVEITQEMREKSRVLSGQIFGKEKLLGWKDKFKTGYEFQADFVGFLGEMAFAKGYGLEEPVFLEQGKDKYDWIIDGKRVDLKTKSEKTKKFLINSEQYDRKKEQIDVFVFGEIYGDYFKLVGWIEYECVPEISTMNLFPNGSKAWAVRKRELNKMGELIVPRDKSS